MGTDGRTNGRRDRWASWAAVVAKNGLENFGIAYLCICGTILLYIVRYFQSLPNIVQFCPILHNIAKYCAILPNIVQYCQILYNIVKYCPILFKIVQVAISALYFLSCNNILRNVKILSNNVKNILILSGIAQFCPVFTNINQMFQTTYLKHDSSNKKPNTLKLIVTSIVR